MHLRTVEIFCDIVAHRSFSKAAEARRISQPAASQAIQHLEERLGVSLIDRSKRPLELTPAGQVYFEGCRNLLDEYRAIEDRVLSLQGKVTGRVRVAAIYSVGLLQMAAYVHRFEQAYPDVELQLDYLHPDEVYAGIRRDEADLGIVSFPRDGGDVACIPWQDQEMGLVVPNGHRLADRDRVDLGEIDGEAFVGFTNDLIIRRETDRLLKRHRVSVKVVHQFDNVENIKRAVEIGAGVSILPLPTARRESQAGTIRALSFRDVEFQRPLGIIHRRQKHLLTAAEKFVEVLHEELGLDHPHTTLVPSGHGV
ncbi:MAG: LysR family transcriptional regulator [Maioricimonas sp. JB045]|uniref:LysR family transcriptional regulator n=1 Tax=Maioricimonas sp. JC845 TaxID=3232138 RepID=UPI0034577D06